MARLRVSLVALPLGDVQDLSARARERLNKADLIFCEDTRKFKELAARAGLECRAKLVALPGDREREWRWERHLSDGANWALVSDAGTPIVNDPGAALLEWCRAQNIAVEAIPGPSAPVLAWQWSGGFGLPFLFAGFAPKARPGTKALEEFFAPLKAARSFCFFDTRHQVAQTLAHLSQAGCGGRRCFVAREMTKPHEELLAGTVSDCAAQLAKRLDGREGVGELTLLVEGEGAAAQAAGTLTLEQLQVLRSAPPREAAKLAAQLSGLSSKECYSALERVKK